MKTRLVHAVRTVSLLTMLALIAPGCLSWRPTVREAEWIVHDAMTRLKYDKRNEVIEEEGLIVDSGFAITSERFRYQCFQYELARDKTVNVANTETSLRKGKLRKETRIDIDWRSIRNILVKTDRMSTSGYTGYYVTFTYRTKNRYGERGEERFTMGRFVPDVNCDRDTVNNVVLALKVLSGKIRPRDTYAGYRHREGYYAEPSERVYREDRPPSWDDPSYRRTIEEPNPAAPRMEPPRSTLPETVSPPPVRQPTVPEVRTPSVPEVRRPTVPETPSLRNSLPDPGNVRAPIPPSVPSVNPPAVTPPSDTTASRLSELKDLYDRGLIGEDMYKQRVSEIKAMAP